jgi:hypothetical protein
MGENEQRRGVDVVKQREGKRRARRGATMAVVMVATLLVMAGSAGATIFDRGSIAEDLELEEDTYTCGEGDDVFEVEVAIRLEAKYVLRVGKHSQAGAFLDHFNVKLWREVHTAETGEVLVLEHRGLYQDIRAVPVDHPEADFMFTMLFAGPVTLSDGDGNVIARDRGSFHWTYLFDSGEPGPGGDFVEHVDVSYHGKDSIGGLDFCALLAG